MERITNKYIGTVLDERYELLEIIGTGGMSVVYKALDHRLNRYVAVKMMREESFADPELKAQFQAESQAVAMLSHPNIVSVYDVSHSKENEYIVMELIEGVTLKQYISGKGRLTPQETLFFASQICQALQHAHEHGIVHRDIKPQNIMIDRNGVVKVADFGIAALEHQNGDERSDTAVGSVHYIAPEQARGLDADARSDLYSLGVVMYEMLTGKLPYEGDKPEEIAVKHIAGTAVRPRKLVPEIPEKLERITMKAMSAELDNRYPSAERMLQDIETFRAGTLKQYRKAAAAAEPVQQPAPEPEEMEYAPETEAPARERISILGVGKELTEAQYARRRKRSRRVSFYSGMLAVALVAIGLFVFLWNYMLRDIFSAAERVDVPDFTGKNYETVINDRDLRDYRFTVVYTVNPDVAEGVVVSQTPEAGKSMMLVPEGIGVQLTVSTGIVMTKIPYVINWESTEAISTLEDAGFEVQTEVKESKDVTKDYVISVDPEPGRSLAAGSIVKVVISGGPELRTVKVPDVTSLSESAAIVRIESYGLTLGTVYREANDAPAGTVFRQSAEPGSSVAEFTKLYLWISTGPETPAPTATPQP